MQDSLPNKRHRRQPDQILFTTQSLAISEKLDLPKRQSSKFTQKGKNIFDNDGTKIDITANIATPSKMTPYVKACLPLEGSRCPLALRIEI